MAKFDRIAVHPLTEPPYASIEFVGMNKRRVPLYRVVGSDRNPSGAHEALGIAFAMYGANCFYCAKRLKPQKLSARNAHRDHVVAASKGGSTRIHNLVFACRSCGGGKADKPVRQFHAEAADRYIAALERHIAKAWEARASEPRPPGPASAAGP